MSSREHEYQMRECVIMYSPGMLEVRGLWLTRLELDRGRGGRRGSSPAEMKHRDNPHTHTHTNFSWCHFEPRALT